MVKLGCTISPSRFKSPIAPPHYRAKTHQVIESWPDGKVRVYYITIKVQIPNNPSPRLSLELPNNSSPRLSLELIVKLGCIISSPRLSLELIVKLGCIISHQGLNPQWLLTKVQTNQVIESFLPGKVRVYYISI